MQGRVPGRGCQNRRAHARLDVGRRQRVGAALGALLLICDVKDVVVIS
jgi:hypothetical protein